MKKKTQTLILAIVVVGLLAFGAFAEVPFANMPVKEVTVFKDGHAFVLHEGQMPANEQGDVVLDYLPRPIIGTFWAYSTDARAELSAVVSGRHIVSVKKTALTIPELIEGNVGKKVLIKEQHLSQAYAATILRIPSRTSEELRLTSPAGSPDELPKRGDIVMLKLEGGVKAVPISRIQEVTFLDEPGSDLAGEEFRNTMTLKLDWSNGKPKKAADVGMVYVQRGIRWIPNYHVEIDGQGNALIKLQATLINELADVEDVKAHLVIGVPTFAFKETVDPISLEETVAQLSRHFREDNQTAYAFSNAIMSQTSVPVRRMGLARSGGTMDLGPEITGSLKNEDLYVFTVEHVTLKKGQRMVLPITEYKLKYRDIFVLNLPFGPPAEVRHRLNSEQQAQLARLFHAPKVIHKIRLSNDSEYPITTAPALIFREGRIIAQGMTTYTAIGAEGDLEITMAVDITVKKSDSETERIPNAEKWNDHMFSRSNLAGKISLTNHRDQTVHLEVTRSVLGHLDSANCGGVVEQLGWNEGGWMVTDGFPSWWYWHSWPYWWFHMNAIGQVTWKLDLEPAKSIDLEYTWHYFWRW